MSGKAGGLKMWGVCVCLEPWPTPPTLQRLVPTKSNPTWDAADRIYGCVPHSTSGSVCEQSGKNLWSSFTLFFWGRQLSALLEEKATLLQWLACCALPAWRCWQQGGELQLHCKEHKTQDGCLGGPAHGLSHWPWCHCYRHPRRRPCTRLH